MCLLTSHLPFALENFDCQSLVLKHDLQFSVSLLLMTQLLIEAGYFIMSIRERHGRTSANHQRSYIMPEITSHTTCLHRKPMNKLISVHLRLGLLLSRRHHRSGRWICCIRDMTCWNYVPWKPHHLLCHSKPG